MADDIYVSFGADTAGLEAGLAKAKAEVGALSVELRKAAQEMQKTGASADSEIGQKVLAAAARLAEAKAHAGSLAGQLRAIRPAAEEGGAGLSKVKEAAEKIIGAVTNLSLGGAIAGLTAVGEAGEAVGSRFGPIGEILGSTAGKFAILVAGMSGAALGAFELGKSAAESIIEVDDLAKSAGTSATEILAIKGAFAEAGEDSEILNRALRRLAITSAEVWPKIQKDVRDSADNQERDLLAIAKAQDEVGKSGEGVASAELSLKEAKYRQFVDRGGQRDPEREKAFKREHDAEAVKAAEERVEAAKRAEEESSLRLREARNKASDNRLKDVGGVSASLFGGGGDLSGVEPSVLKEAIELQGGGSSIGTIRALSEAIRGGNLSPNQQTAAAAQFFGPKATGAGVLQMLRNFTPEHEQELLKEFEGRGEFYTGQEGAARGALGQVLEKTEGATFARDVAGSKTFSTFLEVGKAIDSPVAALGSLAGAATAAAAALSSLVGGTRAAPATGLGGVPLGLPSASGSLLKGGLVGGAIEYAGEAAINKVLPLSPEQQSLTSLGGPTAALLQMFRGAGAAPSNPFNLTPATSDALLHSSDYGRSGPYTAPIAPPTGGSGRTVSIELKLPNGVVSGLSAAEDVAQKLIDKLQSLATDAQLTSGQQNQTGYR